MEPFECIHCKKEILSSSYIGTKHRNHCPFCLYSKHVDLEKPGDRKSKCRSKMEPLGLILKHEGKDKYGVSRVGELMLVHICCNKSCNKISINRIAGDDDSQAIMNIYSNSLSLDDDTRNNLKSKGIPLLGKDSKECIKNQLFGN